MFTTITALILVAIGVTALVAGLRLPKVKEGRYREEEPNAARPVTIGSGVFTAGLGIVILLWASFTLVKATEVGVPVTFGKVGAPLTSGTHWVKPWTSVQTFPIRPLTTEQQVNVRTSEGGKVTATVAARWVVIEAKANDTYYQARTGDDDDIQKKIVDPNLRQAVNTVYSAKTNVDAANDRTKAPALIEAEAKRLLAPYGIDVTTVLLRQVDPDESTARAVAQFAAEQQKTRIATQAKLTADQQALANLATARGIKDAAAELPNLTPEQVVLQCAQTWERMATAAIEKGVPLYTSPCGSSGTAVAVGSGK